MLIKTNAEKADVCFLAEVYFLHNMYWFLFFELMMKPNLYLHFPRVDREDRNLPKNQFNMFGTKLFTQTSYRL